MKLGLAPPSPEPDDGPDFLERTAAGWHLLAYGVFGVGVAVAVLNGSPGCATALAALVVWYAAVGARAFRRDDERLGLAYLVGAYALFAVAVSLEPNALVVLFALYPQTFAFVRLRWAIIATIALSVVFTGMLIARDGFTAEAVYQRGVSGLVNIVFALVAGLFISGIVRQSEQRRALLAELRRTQAALGEAHRQAGVLDERERMSREIHDTLAQGFTSIVMLAQAGSAALDADRPDQARTRLEQVEATARDNLAEARALVATGSAGGAAGLADGDLVGALRRLAAGTAAETGMSVDVEVAGDPPGASAARDVVLLRCAQEALANTRRHAGAAHVDVGLHWDDDGALLQVRDDGAGFDPAATSGGYGLAGMRARVAEAGGLVAVDSAPGRGTTVKVRVP